MVLGWNLYINLLLFDTGERGHTLAGYTALPARGTNRPQPVYTSFNNFPLCCRLTKYYFNFLDFPIISTLYICKNEEFMVLGWYLYINWLLFDTSERGHTFAGYIALPGQGINHPQPQYTSFYICPLCCILTKYYFNFLHFANDQLYYSNCKTEEFIDLGIKSIHKLTSFWHRWDGPYVGQLHCLTHPMQQLSPAGIYIFQYICLLYFILTKYYFNLLYFPMFTILYNCKSEELLILGWNLYINLLLFDTGERGHTLAGNTALPARCSNRAPAGIDIFQQLSSLFHINQVLLLFFCIFAIITTIIQL